MSHPPSSSQMILVAASPLSLHNPILLPLQFPMEWVLCALSAPLGAHPSIHSLLAPAFTLSHLQLLGQSLPQPAPTLSPHRDLLWLSPGSAGLGFSTDHGNDPVLCHGRVSGLIKNSVTLPWSSSAHKTFLEKNGKAGVRQSWPKCVAVPGNQPAGGKNRLQGLGNVLGRCWEDTGAQSLLHPSGLEGADTSLEFSMLSFFPVVNSQVSAQPLPAHPAAITTSTALPCATSIPAAFAPQNNYFGGKSNHPQR